MLPGHLFYGFNGGFRRKRRHGNKGRVVFIKINEGSGFLTVGNQTLLNGLLGLIGPLDRGTAASIADAFLF